MSRPPKSREINIFNFSFLDILACTIGALIFMLVMIMINSSGIIDVSTFQQEHEDLDEKVASLQSELDSIQSQIQKEKSERKKLLAKDAVRNLQTSPKVQKERGQIRELLHDLIADERNADKIKSQIEEMKRQAAKLKEELDHIPLKPQRHQKEIEFNTPLHRETDMPMMLFECAGNRVRPCLTSPAGEIDTKYYNEKKYLRGYIKVLTPKKEGETLSQINRRNSDYQRAMRTINKDQHYAFFVVRPDSYEIFRAARKKMWARGIHVGWEPSTFDVPISLGPSGRGGFQ